jgi:hypothetical protein
MLKLYRPAHKTNQINGYQVTNYQGAFLGLYNSLILVALLVSLGLSDSRMKELLQVHPYFIYRMGMPLAADVCAYLR